MRSLCTRIVLLVGTCIVSAAGALPLSQITSARSLAGAAASQIVRHDAQQVDLLLIVHDESGLASDEHPIYLASNINGWNPSSEAHRLKRADDGTWRIQIPAAALPEGAPLEFKFTLGSWNTEELNASGEVIQNRTLEPVDPASVTAGEPVEIMLAVPAFRQNAPAHHARPIVNPTEVTGELRMLPVTGGAGQAADLERQLLIWLPPGYDAPENAERVYPLLVLMDGQNIFSTAGGAPAEWKADETATKLVTTGKIEPLIIVGVPNSGSYRAQEYLAFDGLPGVQPAGDAFVEWIAETVLPGLRAEYRIADDPARVAIGGSSLGGTIALHAAVTRPDLFGMALVESLSLLRDGSAPRAQLYEYASSGSLPSKIALGMGGTEAVAGDEGNARNIQYRRWAAEVRDTLRDAQPEGGEVMLLLRPDHTHNEKAWSERLPSMLIFLFGA